jgi:hypothetical protein
MNESDTNSLPDDFDDGGELDWSEFDWERYLREQDESVAHYWDCYRRAGDRPDRIDEVARHLGWEPVFEEVDSANDDDLTDDDGPYTVHRNHVFVATRALFANLHGACTAAALGATIPTAQALPLLSALREAELAAVLGVQSLDLGDRTLGIAELKRALAHLNRIFTHLPSEAKNEETERRLTELRERLLPWLFDLREIFLRVVYECRAELGREIEGESEG